MFIFIKKVLNVARKIGNRVYLNIEYPMAYSVSITAVIAVVAIF